MTVPTAPDKPFPDWWTDEQRAASLAQMLASPDRPAGDDVWVFGYGSLLWKPGFAPLERRGGVLRGYQRRFCVVIRRIRGSDDAPGLMMALDAGGECRGVAFRLDPATAQADLEELWRREMVSDIYEPRWVTIEPTRPEEAPVRAIGFVANRAHPRYAPHEDERAAAMIAVARGPAGSCADYLFETSAQLASLGIEDAYLDRLCALVRSRADLA